MRFTPYDMLVAAYEEADPGNGGTIAVARWGAVCPIRTTGSESRIVQAPFKAGVQLTLLMDVDGGNCGLTFASPINAAGNDLATMNDAGDYLHLISVTDSSVATGFKWLLIKNNGCSLSTS